MPPATDIRLSVRKPNRATGSHLTVNSPYSRTLGEFARSAICAKSLRVLSANAFGFESARAMSNTAGQRRAVQRIGAISPARSRAIWRTGSAESGSARTAVRPPAWPAPESGTCKMDIGLVVPRHRRVHGSVFGNPDNGSIPMRPPRAVLGRIIGAARTDEDARIARTRALRRYLYPGKPARKSCSGQERKIYQAYRGRSSIG